MKQSVSIIYTTPSRIDIECDGKSAKLHGESFVRGMGSPDFVIDIGSPSFWETATGKVEIEAAERREIQTAVCEILRARGWSIEIDT
jgi:hypothetical protein